MTYIPNENERQSTEPRCRDCDSGPCCCESRVKSDVELFHGFLRAVDDLLDPSETPIEAIKSESKKDPQKGELT